ncbi:STAS domain-containing protein [Jiangella asiatica]|nr:STAS domain-containing protein [Jiangella asiatica]
MSAVQVVDRGAREIVVFLAGDVSGEPADSMRAAVEEVSRLEGLNALDHVVVDMHQVTELGDVGVAFLRELSDRGRRAGFEVSFAAMSGPAHRAVEAGGWRFAEHSPTLGDTP